MKEDFLKLTNAVYKVLEFFPESDPLKNRAKDKTLAIMEHLTVLYENNGWASFQKEKIKAQLSEDIDILLGYLWIGKTQGWLNSVNFLIISNEYEKIKNKIGPVIHRTQIDFASVLTSTEAKKEGASVSFHTPISSRVHEQKVGISDRQKTILSFLNKNEKAQVMDLQKLFPDITKRTIRRDLDELIEIGQIVRMGDFNQIYYKIKGGDTIGQTSV